MRIYLRKRTPGQIEFGIIYGGIALLMLLAGRFLPLSAFLPRCVFKAATGIPCPTCGATRSIAALSLGDLAGSFMMNPLVSLLLFAAVLSFVYGLFTLFLRLPRPAFSLSEKEKDMARAGVLGLILANWFYLYLAGV